MTLLRDEAASKQLALLRQKAELASEDMKTNKDLLETRAAKQLRRYSDRIIELERLQQAAIEDMLKEDKACQISAVALLERTVGQESQQALGIDCGDDGKLCEGAFDAESSSDAEMDLVGEFGEDGQAIDPGWS
ncbi:hypothetical protein LTR85_000737 [Meristemomyces frigidus]|nr:hypothetical protein LTR85_000737 [Meristemomyces frigidus]